MYVQAKTHAPQIAVEGVQLHPGAKYLLQWRQVDFQTQLQTTRLDAEGADRHCFCIEQSIFAAPHTPRIRLLSASRHRPATTTSRSSKPATVRQKKSARVIKAVRKKTKRIARVSTKKRRPSRRKR
jgi:hypothetical protein